jgi:polyhydroxybutyrate depolymerase
MKSIQRMIALFAALAFSEAGCSSDSGGAGTGGSAAASSSESASGGASSSSVQASGGASSSSAKASGGASSSSAQASGGASSSAAGGASSSKATGTGGTTGTGGVVDKGGTTAPGGTTATGGRTGTAGRTGTGTGTGTGGGTGTAGTTATGGSTGGSTSAPPSGDPDPSPGCSATPITTSPCPASGSSCKIDVKGTAREYYLELPKGYDGKTPAPVVWEYHPWGGTGKGGMTMYSLNTRLTNVIFISPHGTGSPIGFPNTNGMDEDMTRAVNAEVEAKFCTDKSRYFATGFSYGGSMSFTAACNMSDIFRGIGAQAGSTVSGATCARKTPARMVAIWATHGEVDKTLPISNTIPMIEALVKNNGCTTTTKAVDPSPCVEYQGCKEGYPVIWCVRPGEDHTMANTAPDAITKFFKQFF